MMEAQEAERLLSLVGLGRGRGGGGGHGGGFHRSGWGGRGWRGRGGSWVWGNWAPDVIVYNCPPGYYYDLYGNCVPCPAGHYVDEYGRCLPLPGFSGPPASHGGSLPSLTPIRASRRPIPSSKPVVETAATNFEASTTPPAPPKPSDAPIAPRRGPPIAHSLGMDYTPNPTPGDYHVNGNGVILRASPEYTSNAIATLQNGEGVHVFGEVETDPAWKILQNDTVVKNDGERAGIDYVHVGTQTHGAGWIAMPYLEPGAGTQIQKQTQQPSPTPAEAPTTGATNVWPWVLGGSLLVLGGGAIYLVAKHKPSRTATTYRMRTA